MDSKTFEKIVNGAVLTSSVGAFLGSAYLLYQSLSDGPSSTTKRRGAPKENGTKGVETFETSFLDDEDLREGREISSQIFKICITGGPKAGSTTAINKINDELTLNNYKVFVVPSCFSLTKNAGFDLFDKDQSIEDRLKTLICFMRMMMKLEDYFLDIARDEVGRNSVVLFSVGSMDVKARVDPGLWEAMLAETGWSEVTLRGRPD